MEEFEEVFKEIEKPKATFSRIGWAFFAVLIVTTILQFVIYKIISINYPNVQNSQWYAWVLSFAPLYIAAFPLGFFILKPVRNEKPLKKKISIKELLIYFLMCFAVMYIANIIGTIVNSLISVLKGNEVANPVYSMLKDSNIYLNILFAGLLAPVFEELIFRKLLINKTLVYGEKNAIFLSGIMFGLFHGNLTQFFYAFALGIMFAYLYVRTGRVLYTIFMHIAINLFGGVIAPLIFKIVDIDTISELGTFSQDEVIAFVQANQTQLIIFFVYIIAILLMFVVGMIHLIEKRKDVVIHRTELQLKKETAFKTVFLNSGMIVFVLFTICMMVYVVMAL